MNKRPDASPTPEGGMADATSELANAPDLLPPDVTIADAETNPVAPKAFRVVNPTDRTLYMRSQYNLGCQVLEPGTPDCTFFHSCSPLCQLVQEGQTCCVSCEQDLTLYAIPAGQSRLIPWDGTYFVKQDGLCSQCQCDQPTAATSGYLLLSASFYTAYLCMVPGCQVGADGNIDMATTNGQASTVILSFRIPFPEEEVVITASVP